MADSFYENPFKVRLISMVDPAERVSFDVTPTLSVTGGVEYSQVMPIHMPGAQQVYKNTAPRTFTIVATLISRSVSEATKNQDRLHQLLSWRYPYFGVNSAQPYNQPSNDSGAAQKEVEDTKARTDQPNNNQASGSLWSRVEQFANDLFTAVQERALARIRNDVTSSKAAAAAGSATGAPELLGAPPPVLYLYAYSSSDNDNRQIPSKNLNRIPVVIANIDYVYPENVDYLPTVTNEPFPARMEVSITLLETHSPREFEQFSLAQFKAGQLRNF